MHGFNTYGTFEVLATAGNNKLGGDDFDQVLIDYLASEFKKAEGIDLKADNMALQRLKEAAEKAKKELSSTMTTNINLPFITATAEGPKHLNMDLTRAKFNELTADLVAKTMGPTEQAIKDAGVSVSEIDDVLLVGGSTRIPAVQDAVKKFINKDPHKGINPDECVAAGASVQAGVLTGEVNDILLLDVTPLSLGIETLGNVFTKIIERNTTIPTKKSQVFSTAADNQTAVDIHVLQGERAMSYDNTTLGRFQLTNIPPAKRGVPQIEVTFDIDANGIVNVTAKDLGTGKEQKITITSNTNMSEEEIEKKVREAEANAEADKKKKEKIEAVNHAEAIAYQTEQTLVEAGENIAADEKSDIEASIAKVREVKDKEDASVEEINAAVEELMGKFQKVSQDLYAKAQAAQAQQGGQEEAQDQPKDDNVVDADFTEVDDK